MWRPKSGCATPRGSGGEERVATATGSAHADPRPWEVRLVGSVDETVRRNAGALADPSIADRRRAERAVTFTTVASRVPASTEVTADGEPVPGRSADPGPLASS